MRNSKFQRRQEDLSDEETRRSTGTDPFSVTMSWPRSSPTASSLSTYSVSSGNSDSSSKSLSILSLCCSETALEEGGSKQAGNSNTCLCKPGDLPAEFKLPNKFGKKLIRL